MKTTRVLLFLFCFFAIILTSCISANQLPTEADPKKPTKAPTSPSDPPRPAIPWDVPAEETAPSYDAYFAHSIAYIVQEEGASAPTSNVIIGGAIPGYKLTYESPCLYLNTTNGDRLWEVAQISDLQILLYDQRWIYGIEDGTTLFRMDYYGENREILYQDDTGLLGELNNTIYLADGKVMFFFAGCDDGGASIYRLYLPEMKLDTIYHYTSAALQELFFALPTERKQLFETDESASAYRIGSLIPISNHEVTWSSHNPAFYALLAQIAADPDLYDHFFGILEVDFSMCLGQIESDHQIFHLTEHYFNNIENRYVSRNVGVFSTGGGYETWWKNQ